MSFRSHGRVTSQPTPPARHPSAERAGSDATGAKNDIARADGRRRVACLLLPSRVEAWRLVPRMTPQVAQLFADLGAGRDVVSQEAQLGQQPASDIRRA